MIKLSGGDLENALLDKDGNFILTVDGKYLIVKEEEEQNNERKENDKK